jgi:hypothetical protein
MKQQLIKTCTAILIISLCMPAWAQVKQVSSLTTLTIAAPKGTNAFSTAFNNAATGRDDANAYLLCYLTTLVYPQYLAMAANNPSDAYVNHLHSDPVFFQSEYQKYTAGLFASPQFQFVNKTSPSGYDPEAMVISTPSTVYVVFRGTDRVASNKVGSFAYDWGEWLTTDFDALPYTSTELTGKVLRGMWLSLVYEDFKDVLFDAIRQKGGGTKKVWICGHSLGSGQAQLFAMYMAKKGITPQGVYAYAAPHPGTQEFVTELERILPGGRLQRFDFVSDPITTLAPYILGYRRAGTRVYYNDLRTMQFGADERNPAEGLSIIPGLVGATANTVADMINGKTSSKFKLDVFTPGGSPMCYHHPLWYLRAAYNQLTATEKEKVPIPLSIPDQNMEGCDLVTTQRGRTSDPIALTRTVINTAIDGTAAVIEAGLEQLTFAANAIIDNVTGTAITEGDYYIKAYPSNGRLGLNEQDGFTNGSALRLTGSRSKVKIERFGTIGYTITFGARTVPGLFGDETKTYVLDSKAEDLFDDGATTIQLWEKNYFPGASANQRWLFIKVKDNKYVIKNLANGKLLDAHNSVSTATDCSVKTWNPVSNDQTQIWILDKAN